MRAARNLANSMAQNLDYMVIARSCLINVEIARTNEQGPTLVLLLARFYHEGYYVPRNVTYEPRAIHNFDSLAPQLHAAIIKLPPRGRSRVQGPFSRQGFV